MKYLHFRRNRDIEKIYSTYGSHACYGSFTAIIISNTFLGIRSSSRQGLRNPARVIATNGKQPLFSYFDLKIKKRNIIADSSILWSIKQKRLHVAIVAYLAK